MDFCYINGKGKGVCVTATRAYRAVQGTAASLILRVGSNMEGAEGPASRIDRLAPRNGRQITTEQADGGLRNRTAFSGQKKVFVLCRCEPAIVVHTVA
jgi:hypothetical protein